MSFVPCLTKMLAVELEKSRICQPLKVDQYKKELFGSPNALIISIKFQQKLKFELKMNYRDGVQFYLQSFRKLNSTLIFRNMYWTFLSSLNKIGPVELEFMLKTDFPNGSHSSHGDLGFLIVLKTEWLYYSGRLELKCNLKIGMCLYWIPTQYIKILNTPSTILQKVENRFLINQSWWPSWNSEWPPQKHLVVRSMHWIFLPKVRKINSLV